MTPQRYFLSVFAPLLVLLCGCPSKPAAGPAKPPAAKTDAALQPTAAAAPAEGTPALQEAKAPLADWPQPAVAFVLTGQQIGYIEPCGCTGLENQKGGLARRHTFIRQLREDRGWNVVPLDVGGQVKRFGKQQELKFTHTVQALRQMGYKAIGFGAGDLGLAPGDLYAAIAPPDGPLTDFVSANVAVLGRELVPRYVIIVSGNKRIAVTSIVADKYVAQLRSDELIREPSREALESVANELDTKPCDYYVLLVSGSLDEARGLAKAAPMFDLVVASGESALQSYELESIEGSKTKLMQVGQKAMHVGIIGLFPGGNPPLRYETVPLDARFPDSPEMLQILAEYQQNLQDAGLDGLGIKLQPHPSGRQFVGSETCADCHSKAYAKWSTTPHAHALDSLVTPPNSRGSIARHFDPECLSCHVTGWEPQQYFPYDSGYLSLEGTPQLKHNGCENCHGPGSAHVAAENGEGDLTEEQITRLRESMKLPLAGGVAEQRCIQCHDIDNSPDFHKPGAFERYWQEVEHRGKD